MSVYWHIIILYLWLLHNLRMVVIPKIFVDIKFFCISRCCWWIFILFIFKNLNITNLIYKIYSQTNLLLKNKTIRQIKKNCMFWEDPQRIEIEWMKAINNNFSKIFYNLSIKAVVLWKDSNRLYLVCQLMLTPYVKTKHSSKLKLLPFKKC